jgi:hypothetical protein
MRAQSSTIAVRTEVLMRVFNSGVHLWSRLNTEAPVDTQYEEFNCVRLPLMRYAPIE